MFSSRRRQAPGATRNGRVAVRSVPRLETLDDRTVPATLYVDAPADFLITADTGRCGRKVF